MLFRCGCLELYITRFKVLPVDTRCCDLKNSCDERIRFPETIERPTSCTTTEPLEPFLNQWYQRAATLTTKQPLGAFRIHWNHRETRGTISEPLEPAWHRGTTDGNHFSAIGTTGTTAEAFGPFRNHLDLRGTSPLQEPLLPNHWDQRSNRRSTQKICRTTGTVGGSIEEPLDQLRKRPPVDQHSYEMKL